MSESVLSIKMPVCIAERYVRKAIKSILNKTVDNLELVISVDGSTDNSLAEIQSLNDPRIKLFWNGKNQRNFYHRN